MMNNNFCQILLFLFSFCVINLYGQSHTSDTSFYNDKHDIKSIRFFSNNKPDSVVYYYPNGRQQQTFIYSGKGGDGYWINFNENGIKYEQHFIKDDEFD